MRFYDSVKQAGSPDSQLDVISQGPKRKETQIMSPEQEERPLQIHKFQRIVTRIQHSWACFEAMLWIKFSHLSKHIPKVNGTGLGTGADPTRHLVTLPSFSYIQPLHQGLTFTEETTLPKMNKKQSHIGVHLHSTLELIPRSQKEK